ncbi:MAG: rhomboid family intramembrane serine protease [Candidatus Melainabacteria bacterium]|nr:rhomboid family intramembrane serine protease [Candidatus Melainabacteria bacterium]
MTALFIHDGWPHVIISVIPLALFAAPLERAIGWKGLLIGFFVGGIGGEIGSSVTLLSLSNGDNNTGTIGASPAIYAIIALFIVGCAPLWRKYWFQLGLTGLILALEALAIFHAMTNPSLGTAINHASHVSGFLIGLVLSFWLVQRVPNGKLPTLV